MPIFTRYEFNGELVESRFIDVNEITNRKYSCLGQMIRVTINNAESYEGFEDEPYLSGKGNCLTLKWYDINYETFHLKSGNMTTIFIPLEIIDKIEAILYSNPRWGHPPINEFVFSQDLKSRLMAIHNEKIKNNGLFTS